MAGAAASPQPRCDPIDRTRYLDRNQLRGTLPAELGKLADLEDLCGPVSCAADAAFGGSTRRSACAVALCSYLFSNMLTGTIGSWISSTSKLTSLCDGRVVHCWCMTVR